MEKIWKWFSGGLVEKKSIFGKQNSIYMYNSFKFIPDPPEEDEDKPSPKNFIL